MKKMALSAAVLLVAGLGVTAIAGGCSTSPSAGATPGMDSGVGDSSGSSSGGDSSTSSSSGGDSSTSSSSGGDASSSSGGDSGGDSGPTCPFPPPDSGLPPIETAGADGGPNTGCDTCLNTNCKAQFDCCYSDTNHASVTTEDGGTAKAPACYAFVLCVESEVATLASTSDAGLSMDVATAIADCEGPDGGTFPTASTEVGKAFISCTVTSCLAQCAP